MKERIKKTELENVHRLNNHEYKLLYNRVREGQRMQEEASRARKVLARRLEREQHLAVAKRDHEVAKPRSSMLSRSWRPLLFPVTSKVSEKEL